jgi:hypothetical protein
MSKSNCTKVYPGRDPGPRSVPKYGIGKFDPSNRYYIFILSHTVRIFFPELNIRLYDKNSETDFFSLHQNQNIFFGNIGNQKLGLEKNHNSPPGS